LPLYGKSASLKAFISPNRKVIITHFKPDADALGFLGLAGFLEEKGIKFKVITPSDYPNFLAWMPGNEESCPFEGIR